MTEPTTVNIALIVPNTGDLPGTWGSNALNPDFASIDGFFGGVQTISLSNANIELTAPSGSITPGGGPTQSQNSAIKFTGVLTGNVQITLPLPGYIIVHNLTTGNFVVTFAAVGSGQIISTEQGSAHRIYNDGANVYFTDLPPVGTYLDTCDSAVPAWINACTVPPYLLVNGGTFSSGTYPYLALKLGGTTLPDGKGRSRYMLNLGSGRLTTAGAGIDGNTLLAAGGNNGVSLIPGQIPAGVPSSNAAQVISVTTTQKVVNGPNQGSATGGGSQVTAADPGSGGALSVVNATGTNSIAVTSTNASQSVVQSTTPGYVGGITMIRAA